MNFGRSDNARLQRKGNKMNEEIGAVSDRKTVWFSKGAKLDAVERRKTHWLNLNKNKSVFPPGLTPECFEKAIESSRRDRICLRSVSIDSIRRKIPGISDAQIISERFERSSLGSTLGWISGFDDKLKIIGKKQVLEAACLRVRLGFEQEFYVPYSEKKFPWSKRKITGVLMVSREGTQGELEITNHDLNFQVGMQDILLFKIK